MKRQTYNPYKAKTQIIDRFRGVVNPENHLTMDKEYVGSSDNAVSYKLGELNQRPGQEREVEETIGAIHGGAHLISLVSLAAGPDVFVDQVSDRFIRTQEVDFPKRIPITEYNPILSKTCGALWAENPTLDAYRDTAQEETNAYASDQSISDLCWNLPVSVAPVIPRLPGPAPVKPPKISPIIPDWDFGGVPTGDGGGEGLLQPRCQVKSIDLDTTELNLVTQQGSAATTQAITVTITGTGEGFYGKMKAPEFNSELFEGSRADSVTRSRSGETISLSSVYTIKQNMSVQTELGQYKGAVKLCFEICGREYCRCVQLNGTVSSKVREIDAPASNLVSIGGSSSRSDRWNYSHFAPQDGYSFNRTVLSETPVTVGVADGARPSGTSGKFKFIIEYTSAATRGVCPKVGGGYFPHNMSGTFPGTSGTSTYGSGRKSLRGTSDKTLSVSGPPSIAEFVDGKPETEPWNKDGVEGGLGAGFCYAGAATPPYYRSVSRGPGAVTKIWTYVDDETPRGGDHVCI